MDKNNMYNFKNPIRHFLDINRIEFPDNLISYTIKKDLSRTVPIKFRINKVGDKYRTLKMPNILNFAVSYENCKNEDKFSDIELLDEGNKRLSTNLITGDFKKGEYDKWLEKDFKNLCIYDNLIRLDIKEYYGRMYTHYIGLGEKEKFITNMNKGATNGLIMGNYISLYWAERNLCNISKKIKNMIEEEKIDCVFSYFSDDFYFFCNEENNDNVIRIFDSVLESYDLERSDKKEEIWTYESYNNYNLVSRFSKKIIYDCENRDKELLEKGMSKKLHFINQIIYRISTLDDIRLKKIFINNFFKTKYFRELDLGEYEINDYSYHQICFIYNICPESILYTLDKFKEISNFDCKNLKYYFDNKYKKTLKSKFNEEQMYVYYALKILEFDDLLSKYTKEVMKSDNQILISYYLKEKLFYPNEIESLKMLTDEEYWFQNYHFILYDDEMKGNLVSNIMKYLLPDKTDNHQLSLNIENLSNKHKNYINFYKKNLELGIPIIREFQKVNDTICDYISIRIKESEDEDIEF